VPDLSPAVRRKRLGLELRRLREEARYGAVFDDLRSQALGTAESADLIARLAAMAR